MAAEEKIVKILPCSLTEQELRQRSDQLSAVTIAADEAEKSVASLKEKQKADLSSAQTVAAGKHAQALQLSRVISTRTEDREVGCTKITSRRARVETVRRDDTGEVVSERPLSDVDIRTGAKWVADWTHNTFNLIHPDEPDYVIERRAPTQEERQTQLALDKETKAAAKAADVSVEVVDELDISKVDDRSIRKFAVKRSDWMTHRTGLQDAKGKPLQGRWHADGDDRVLTLDAGEAHDQLVAYAQLRGINLRLIAHVVQDEAPKPSKAKKGGAK